MRPESEVDHLEILGAGDGGEGVRPCTDVEEEGLLEPRDEEVSPFSDGLVDDSPESVEENRPLTSVDGVQRRVDHRSSDAETQGGARHVRQERHGGLAASHFCVQGIRDREKRNEMK